MFFGREYELRRLKDNYARFYLKYMLPVRDRIAKGLFEFVSHEGLAEWDAVMGLQFENLVVNNFKALLPRLEACVKTTRAYDFLIPSNELLLL